MHSLKSGRKGERWGDAFIKEREIKERDGEMHSLKSGRKGERWGDAFIKEREKRREMGRCIH